MKILKSSIVLMVCLVMSFGPVKVFANDIVGENMNDTIYYSEGNDSDVKVEFDEESEITSFSLSKYISWSVGNNIEKRSSTFQLKKNGKVSFGLKLSKTTNVTVGIIDSNNKKTYVKGEKNFVKTLTAPSAGTYRVFVKNKSGSKISVYGTYTR